MVVKDIIVNLNHNKIKLMGMDRDCRIICESKVMDDLECITYMYDHRIMHDDVSFISVSDDIVYIHYFKERF